MVICIPVTSGEARITASAEPRRMLLQSPPRTTGNRARSGVGPTRWASRYEDAIVPFGVVDSSGFVEQRDVGREGDPAGRLNIWEALQQAGSSERDSSDLPGRLPY